MKMNSNVVKRSIGPIALNGKNALFAGSDGGGEHWATVASLIETCKLSSVEPDPYLTDVITKIVNGHPNSQSMISCLGSMPPRPRSKQWPKTAVTHHRRTPALV